jgi:hypothetical protein
VSYADPERQREYQRLWATKKRRQAGIDLRPEGESSEKQRARKKRFKKNHPEKIRTWRRRDYSKKTYGIFAMAHRDLLTLKRELRNTDFS